MNKKPLVTRSDKIYVAGHTGMVGSAILRALKEKGYGDPEKNGEILTTTRREVNLLEKERVELWFNENQRQLDTYNRLLSTSKQAKKRRRKRANKQINTTND